MKAISGQQVMYSARRSMITCPNGCFFALWITAGNKLREAEG
jgi:hypothetical protein